MDNQPLITHYMFFAYWDYAGPLVLVEARQCSTCIKEYLPRDSLRFLQFTSDGENFRGVLKEFHMDYVPYFAAISWC